jgi:hypothetical protein
MGRLKLVAINGYWSIVVPSENVNYVKNPSFENDLTGWASDGAGSGTATQSDEWQYSGIYSLKLVKTVSAGQWGYQYSVPDYADFASLSATVSVRYKVDSGTLNIAVAGTGVSTVTEAVTGEGEAVITVGPLSAGITALTVTAYFADATTGTAYIDAIQIEKDTRQATYFDGDSDGAYWQGIIHNSKSNQTIKGAVGGKIYSLDDYQVAVESSPGMGMPPIELQTQKQALLPGSLLRGYTVKERSVTLNCMIIVQDSQSRQTTHSLRQDLIDLIKPDRIGDFRPFWLQYDGANLTQPIYLPVVYDSGLDFNPLDGFSEEINLRLVSPSALWRTFKQTAYAVTERSNIASMRGILAREDGVWQNIGVNASTTTISVIGQGPNGLIYFGGLFANAGGVGDTQNLGVWNPETQSFSSIDSANGQVISINFDSQGDLYLTGAFTSVNSVANTSRIAKYDTSAGTWSSITPSGAADNSIFNSAFDSEGNLYVVGNFTTINGVAATRIAKMDTSGTWTALGTGLNGLGRAVVVAPDDTVYVGGDFTTANGVTVNMIARWNGTTFEALSDGTVGITGSYVQDLLFHNDGRLFITGNFTAAGGVTASHIAIWNGLQYAQVGLGFNAEGVNLQQDSLGQVWATGSFDTTAGGEVSLKSKTAIWNGSLWIPVDLFRGSNSTNGSSLALASNGNVYVGTKSADAAWNVSAITTLTVPSTTQVYPIFTIERTTDAGTATVVWLENQTNGKKLVLDYALLPGETLTIDLTLGQRKVVSSLKGLVWNAILPTSDIGTFVLQPGENEIAALVHETGSASVSIYAVVPTVHWSFDGVAT